MIILIISTVFGLGISGMMMGMMRAGSSSSIILDMQNIKPPLTAACNKPAGISQLVIDSGEPCETDDECSEAGTRLERQTTSDIEFVQAPTYPNQLNCITCSDLLIRGLWRTGLAVAMTVADMYDKKKSPATFATDQLTEGRITGKAPQALDNLRQIATSYGDELGEGAAKYGDDFADAAADAMRQGNLDDGIRAGSDAVLAACGGGDECVELAADLARSLFDDAGRYSDNLVKDLSRADVETTLRKSFDDYNADYNKQVSNIAEEIAQEQFGQPLGQEGLENMAKQVLADNGKVPINIDAALSDTKTWAALQKSPSLIESIGGFLKNGVKVVVCGAGGFSSTFTRGAAGSLSPATDMANAGKLNACGVARLVGTAFGLELHLNSLIKNYNYIGQDIDRYVQYLQVIQDHYDTLDEVLSDNRVEVAISMDQSLFVSDNHTSVDQFFQLGQEAMPYSSDMFAKFIEANSNLYDIMYNTFGDYAYADYYFSMSADTRISNTFWSGIAAQIDSELKGTPAGNERVVMLRPQHISALLANSRTYMERRTESKYPDIFQRVVEKYSILYSEFNYPTLDEAIAFLESLDTESPSILADLEALELQDAPEKKTTREEMLAVIEKLKTVRKDVDAIWADENQLLAIQERAWTHLSDPGCNSDPLPLGDIEIVKSRCAVVQNCNWDYVVDYSFYEGKIANIGDCVNLAVIVNGPSTNDPLTGDTVWRSIPAFKMSQVETAAMLGMLTLARSRGLVKATERLAGGITFGSIGNAIGSWTDMAQYCNETTDTTNTMMCCIETADCRVGLCKICDSFRCARPINIEPRLQPGIVVDTTSSSEIKIIGNVGILG